MPVVKPLFELAALDAVNWLRELPTESVDLVVTDPAYESLEKHRAVGTTTRLKHSKSSSNDWFRVFPNARFGELFAEVFRVLKPDTHFYLFCDAETMFVAKPEAERAGFKFWKPLVWDKRTIGMGYHYRARYEFILFFEKGKRRLNDLGVADIITEPRIHRGYPAEKPVAVSEVIIGQSSQAGRRRGRSVHGIGQRRRRGAEARTPIHRHRSQSRSRAPVGPAAAAARRGQPAGRHRMPAGEPDLLALMGSRR